MRQFHGTDSDLANWWRERNETDIEKTVPKAIEYGAQDLLDMGSDAASILGREGVSNEEAMEIAIWFYLRGKLARWTAAIRRGDRVSDDTVFDIGIYARMVQRIREVGEWPGDFAAQIEGRERHVVYTDPYTGVAGYTDADVTDSESMDVTGVADYVDPESVKAFDQPPAGDAEVEGRWASAHWESEEPPATADQRNQSMREIHNFRNRLKSRGFREFNAVGELLHDETHLKVSTQYESMGDWRVKIWHNRTLTVNEFIPRNDAKQALANLELIEWRSEA
jgi:hypothetical protein